MKEIKLEFSLNTSPTLLYSRISNPSGLAEWFADNVKIDDKVITFIWGDTEQQAEIVNMTINSSITFRWLDREDGHEFRFDIIQDELTNDVALIITDHIEDDDDEEDSKELWSSQIGKLKQTIGS